MQSIWLSDHCLQLQDQHPICPIRHRYLLLLCQDIKQTFASYLQDVVLAYHSITLHFSPAASKPLILNIKRYVQTLATQEDWQASLASNQNTESEQTLHTIPVYYGGEVALDSALLQQQSGLSWAEIIALHAGSASEPRRYHAYASGFTPGFAYLGTLDSALHCERRATPRAKIPAGSVAIAADQTAIYPSSSPGGWLIIGKTPISLIHKPVDVLIHPGDNVQFVPIDQETFIAQGGNFAHE